MAPQPEETAPAEDRKALSSSPHRKKKRRSNGGGESPDNGDDDQERPIHRSASQRSFPHSRQASMSHNSTGTAGAESTASSSSALAVAAKHQRRALTWSKCMILVILVLTAALFSISAYSFTKQQEQDELEGKFSDFAAHAQDVILLRMKQTAQSQSALSNFVTATVDDDAWPFATIPAFEAAEAVSYGVAMAPLLEPYQREEWIRFAQTSREWMSESRGYLLKDDNNGSDSISIQFPNVTQRPSAEGRFAPIRQVAPIERYGHWLDSETDNPVDLMSIPCLDTAIQEFFETPKDTRPKLATLQSNITMISSGDSSFQPVSIMLVPVFNRFPTIKNSDHHVVAVLAAVTPWLCFVDELLPEGTPDMTIVVRNSCGLDHRFSIQNGSKSVYVGDGDLHDDTFGNLEMILQLPQFGSHVGIDDNEGKTCIHTIHLFPTEDMEEEYLTSKPIWFAGIVLMIFGLVLLTIVIYDILVERRQHLILSTAHRSETLVSSLFPETVRHRLLQHERLMSTREYDGTSDDDASTDNDARVLVENGGVWSNPFRFRANRRSRKQKKLRRQRRAGWNVDGNGSSLSLVGSGKPIADLFPNATVLFADISGFTAWSSSREPTQVFILLERIYNAFDAIANRRQVFKVETIGDCYVAATGLPERRRDHALVMAQFSMDCMIKMKIVVRKLEVVLGPDTAELTMRFGLHSGPVTAGVLRGEKSRFQLFGDTVNTAARMESTGLKDKIQLSEDTANQLVDAGKSSWIRKRDDMVDVKGKGLMTTYWLHVEGARFSLRSLSAQSVRALMRSSSEDGSGDCGSAESGGGRRPTPVRLNSNTEICTTSWYTNEGEFMPISQVKRERLIDWNVDVMSNQLRKIVAMRSEKQRQAKPQKILELEVSKNCTKQATLDEVQEIIVLPSRPGKYKEDPESVVLSPQVVAQLRSFVSEIAKRYRNNSFHSFEHASHVTQSVTKLMARVVTPEAVLDGVAGSGNSSSANSSSKPSSESNTRKAAKKAAVALHQYTYGITSDPLTQFACAFSALIHDCDHPGVSNDTLVAEQTPDAIKYKNKSVAEQKSVDIAWELLMTPQFADLRMCIYSSQAELDRFRQLVVNSVMATDIADKELGALRKARWDKAFSRNESGRETTPRSSKSLSAIDEDVRSNSPSRRLTESVEDINRKATIVIEHLIQASDVSHTMQHWHIYVKWNERLFHECFKAHAEGRTGTDPSVGWYTGELGFFDFYIIPLARKLKECGVFGVASDEYLQYARANREEWERKGRDIVEGYMETYQKLADRGESNARDDEDETERIMDSIFDDSATKDFEPSDTNQEEESKSLILAQGRIEPDAQPTDNDDNSLADTIVSDAGEDEEVWASSDDTSVIIA